MKASSEKSRHPFTIEAVKIYIQRKEELYGSIKDNNFLFGNAVKDKDTGEIDDSLHYRVFDKAVLLFLKLIKHKNNFTDFFSDVNELVKTVGDIKALQEELIDMKNAGKGTSFYSFRKIFRTMLGLSNDLAEYYMGHKLGDNSKTTYIQVNSLDNKLFVEEYAAPVIAMLDKFVFYNEEELKNLAGKDKSKMKDHIDFVAAKIERRVPLHDIFIDYAIKEYTEYQKENPTHVQGKGYFDRI